VRLDEVGKAAAGSGAGLADHEHAAVRAHRVAVVHVEVVAAVEDAEDPAAAVPHLDEARRRESED
jgi:hypothetical protein